MVEAVVAGKGIMVHVGGIWHVWVLAVVAVVMGLVALMD